MAQVTDERIPFFTSDQLAEYRAALLHVYGQWYQPVRNGTRGRYPERRLQGTAQPALCTSGQATGSVAVWWP